MIKPNVAATVIDDIAILRTVTAANAHDITEASKLLREDDEVVYGDGGYVGIEKREEIKNDP